jgi:hypothetical protein
VKQKILERKWLWHISRQYPRRPVGGAEYNHRVKSVEITDILTWPRRTSGGLVGGFQPRRPAFEPGSGHVGFVVDKAAQRHFFSEYLRFPCQAFHRLLYTHHPGPVQQVSSGHTNSELGSIAPQKRGKKKLSLNLVNTNVTSRTGLFDIMNHAECIMLQN